MMMLAPILAGSATAGVSAAVPASVAAAGFGAIGGGAVAGSSFSLAGLLSGGFSVVSGLASIAKGNAQAQSLEDQSLWEQFNARQELTRGKTEAVAALKAGNDAVAAAQVAGFASGLQSSGSVTQAKLDASSDAQLNADLATEQAMAAAGARRGEAARLRSDAASARRGGVFDAIGTWGTALGQFAATG